APSDPVRFAPCSLSYSDSLRVRWRKCFTVPELRDFNAGWHTAETFIQHEYLEPVHRMVTIQQRLFRLIRTPQSLLPDTRRGANPDQYSRDQRHSLNSLSGGECVRHFLLCTCFAGGGGLHRFATGLDTVFKKM